MTSNVTVEPIKTDGPIDTGAIFAKIKQLEAQLMSHKTQTSHEFQEVNTEIANLKGDYKAYTDKKCGELDDRFTATLNKAVTELQNADENIKLSMDKMEKAHVHLEQRVAALEKKIQAIWDRLSTMGNNTGGAPMMDDGRIDNLERRVQALEDALENLKNDIARWIKELQDMIN